MSKKVKVYNPEPLYNQLGFNPSEEVLNRMSSVNYNEDPFQYTSTSGLTDEDTEYGIGYGNIEDIEDIRSGNQSGIAQLRNGLVRSALSIGTKMGSGFGYVGGVADAIVHQDPNKIFDNEWADLFENAEEDLKKAIPVHMSKEYRDGNILNKMTTTSFWANDFFDGLAYVASAALTGGGIGKLGGAIGNVFKWGEKGLKNFQTYGATVYQTVMEAGAEADGVAKQVEQEMRSEGIKDENLIKQKKGEAGLNTFLANSAILFVPNYIQSTFLFGNPNKNMSKLVNDIVKGTTKEGEIKAWHNAMKSAAEGFASEGLWEENIQTAIQNFETNKALGRNKEDDNYLTGLTKEYLNNFTTDEGWTSIMLGGITGAPLGAYHGLMEGKEEKKAIEEGKKIRKESLDKLNLAQSLLTDNVKNLYNVNDKGRIINDDGSFNLNKTKVVNEALNQLTNKKLMDEQLSALITGDEFKADHINNLALGRLAYSYLSNPTFTNSTEAIDSAKKYLDGLADGASKTETEKGEDNSDIPGVLGNYKTKLDEMKSAWDEYADKSFEKTDLTKVTKDSLEDDLLRKSIAKKLYFLEKIKQQSFEQGKSKINKSESIEQLDKLINDSKEFEKKLLTKDGRNELFKDVVYDPNNGFFSHDEVSSKQRNLDKAAKEYEKDNSEENKTKLDKATYEYNEAKSVFGNLNPVNRELNVEKERIHSLRDEYYRRRGLDHLNNYNIVKSIDDYEKGIINLNEVINTMSKYKTEIDNKDVDKVKSLIDKETSKIPDLENEYQTIVDRMNSMSEVRDNMDNDMFDFTPSQLEELDTYDRTGQRNQDELRLEDISQQIDDINKAKSNVDDFESLKNERQENKKFIENATNEDLKVLHAKSELENPTSIINAYESNKETFSREDDTIAAIDKLNVMESILKERDNEKYKNLLKEINSLQSKLKEALNTAAQNKSNKAAKDDLFLKNETDIKISSLGVDKINNVVNPPLNNLIKDTLTESEFNRLTQMLSDDNTNNSGVVNLFFEKLRRILKSKNELKTFIDKLDILIKDMNDHIIKNAHSYLLALANTEQSFFKHYLKNPEKQVVALISNEQGKKVDEEVIVDPIQRFISTGDIHRLKQDIDNNIPTNRLGVTNESLKLFLEQHFKLVALHNLKKELQSDYNIKSEIENEIKSKEKIVPTNEQISAIRNFVRFFNTTIGNDSNFTTTAYLKGVFGTGKTTMVAKWAVKLLNLKTNEVFAVGHNESSTQTINSSLSLNNTIEFNNLKSTDIHDSVKLLIVDEIGAFTPEQVDKLGKLISEVNKKRLGGKIQELKVLIMGDPAQINTKFFKDSQISTIDSGLYGDEDITLIGTLTIPYRSNIVSIGDMAEVYQNNPKKVLSVDAKALQLPGTLNNYGVVGVGDYNKLIEELSLNKGRKVTKDGIERDSTRVIIVTEEKDKLKYNNTGEKVLTFIEAQGTTFDEVYIDINPNSFKTDIDYNTAMYTSIGRGRNFVSIVDYNNAIKNKVNEELLNNKSRLDKQLEDNVTKFNDRLENELSILEELKDKKHKKDGDRDNTNDPVDTKDKTDDEVEDEYEEVDEQSNHINDDEDKEAIVENDLNPEKNTKELIVNKKGNTETLVDNIHTLTNPSYDPIKKGKGILEVQTVFEGSPVRYVKRPESTSESGWIISVEAQDNQFPETYHKIGILSKEEYSELLEAGLIKEIEDKEGVVGTGKVEVIRNLEYKYIKKSDYYEGKGLIKRLLNRFRKQFIRDNKQYKLVNAQILIYTKEQLKSKELKGKRKAGIPYLKLTIQTGKNKQDLKDQFIRLNPRKLNINDFREDGEYSDLHKFYQLIEELSKYNIEIGTDDFYNVLHDWSKNYTVDENNKLIFNGNVFNSDELQKKYNVSINKVNEFQEIIDNIVKLMYDVDNSLVSITLDDFNKKYSDTKEYSVYNAIDNSYTDKNKVYSFEPVKNKKTGKISKKGRVRIQLIDKDGNLHDNTFTSGDKTIVQKYLHEKQYKVNKGRVPHLMNLLAHANTYIGSNKFRVIREIEGHKTYTSKSLVTSKNSLSTLFPDIIKSIKDRQELDAAQVKAIRNDLYTLSDTNELIEYLTDNNYLDVESINTIIHENINKPITRDMLKELVDDSSFNSKGEYKGDYYMLKPLPLISEDIDINNIDSKYENDLSSNFTKIIPTTIQVKMDGISQQKPSTKEEQIKTESKVETKTSKKDLLDKIKNKNKIKDDENYRDIDKKSLSKSSTAKLGEKLSIVEVRKLIKKLIPNITESELKIVDSLYLSLKDSNDWGWYLNGVITLINDSDNSIHENAVRHEVFHKIFTEFLSKKEQENIIKVAKLQYSELREKALSDWDIEEILAEKFQEWRKDNSKVEYGVLRKFYNWLLNLLGFSRDFSRDLNKLFNAIDEGYFTKPINTSQTNLSSKHMIKINEKFGSISMYRKCKSSLLYNFNKLVNNGLNGYPVSKDEIYSIVKQDYINRLEDDSSDYKELINLPEEDKNDPEIQEAIRNILDSISQYQKIIDNYDRLIEVLFPNYNSNKDKFTYTEYVDEPTEEELIELSKNPDKSVNLTEETVSSEERNMERSITMNIKNLLSNIPVYRNPRDKNSEIKKWLNPRFAYVKALQLLEGFTSWEEGKVVKQFETLKRENFNESVHAILDKFIEIYNTAIKDYPVTNIKILNEDTILYSPDKSINLSEIKGEEEIESLKNKYKDSEIIVERRFKNGKYVTTESWLNGLIKRDSNLNKELLFDMYQTMRATNDFRELITNFVSLKQKNIRYLEVKSDYGKLYFAYKTGKNMSVVNAKISEVKGRIIDKFPTYKAYKEFASEHEKEYKKLSFKEPAKLTREFLKFLDYDTSLIPDDILASSADDIYHFISDSSRWDKIGTVITSEVSDQDLPTISKEELVEDYDQLTGESVGGEETTHTDNEVLSQSDEHEETVYTTDKAIEDHSRSLMNDLGDILTYTNESIRPTSSIGADGRKKYTYSPGSTGIDLLKRLSDYMRRRSSEKSSHATYPRYLNDTYLKNNIFMNGKQTIYNIIETDGIRMEDSIGEISNVVTYTEEKFIDYIQRTFIGGFIESISNSSRARYSQHTYTISDKPVNVAAEISVLNKEKSLDAIKSIITQLSTRPDYTNVVKNGSNKRSVNFNVLYDALQTFPEYKEFLSIESKTGTRLIDWEGLKLDEKKIEAISNQVLKEIEQISEQLVNKIIINEIDLGQDIMSDKFLKKLSEVLSKEQYAEIHNSIKKLADPKFMKNAKYKETWNDVKDRIGRPIEPKDRIQNPRKYLATKEILLPLVNLFVTNDYINSHQLNQLFLGESGFFKTGLDVVKRMSGVFSPGLRGLVHSKLGMNRKFNIAIIKDIANDEPMLTTLTRMTDEETAKKLVAKHNRTYDKLNEEPNNAQGFITPKRYAQLKAGYGEGYNLETTLKPVYYGVDEMGIPRFLKYSSIVLTDELIYGTDEKGNIDKTIVKFPKLLNLRNNMENANVDEVLFESGMKVGVPTITENENNLLSPNHTIDTNSIVELDNTNFRLQLNPRHEVDSLVANPTQLGYFLKILETNIDAAERVYTVMGKLITNGFNKFKSELKSDDGSNPFTASKFIGKLKKVFEQGSDERVYELLNILADTGLRHPWDFPTITDKALIQFSSMLSKYTTKIKFSGSKFVLQSDLGIEIIDDKTGKKRPLQYTSKIENGKERITYAECVVGRGFLPENQEKELLDIIRKNELAQKFNEEHEIEILNDPSLKQSITPLPDIYVTSDLLGFRIPSSELHSAIAIKVTGFHEYGKNKIIAPNKIVVLHGSDYDVDSLFVIRKSYIENDKGDYTPIGYKKNESGKFVIDYNIPIDDLVKEFGITKDKEGNYISDKTKNNTLTIAGTTVNLNKIDPLKAIKLIEEEYYKNIIVETFLQTITDSKNSERMGSPVSVDAITHDLDKIAELKGLTSYKQLQKEVDSSNILDRQLTHTSAHEAKSGVGIFANGIKVLAYMIGSSSKKGLPTLTLKKNSEEEFKKNISINGRILSQLVDKPELWSDLDSFSNAAIDNVKEQILPILNLTSNTIKSFVAMRGLGMTMEEANRFMLQPVIFKMLEYKKDSIMNVEHLLNKIYGDKISSDYNIKNVEITTEILEKFIKSGITIDDLINKEELTDEDREFVVYQYAILSNYRKFEAIGKDLSDLSRYLNIIRDFPVTADTIEETVGIRNRIFKDKDFSLDIENFFNSNPHIKAADEVLAYLDDIKNKTFFKHSETLKTFVDRLLKVISLKLDNNPFTSKMKIRNDVMKYIISGVQWDEDFDLSKQPPYTYKDSKGIHYIYGAKAFSKNFAIKVAMLKKMKQYEDNKFLQSLEVKTYPSLKVVFTQGVNIEYDLIQELQDDFDKLKGIVFTEKYNKKGNFTGFEYGESDFIPDEVKPYSKFQNEFTHYSILNTGLSFGTMSYSQILPPQMYIKFAQKMEKAVSKILHNPTLFDNIFNNFIVQAAVINGNKVERINDKPISTGKIKKEGKEYDTYEGYEKDTYFDLKFEDKKGNLPLFTYRQYKKGKTNRINVYIQVNNVEGIAYYQKISMKTSSSTYDLNDDVLNGKYDLRQAFRPDIRHYFINKKEDKYFDTSSLMNTSGQTISIGTYDDVTRSEKKYAMITSIKELENGNKRVFIEDVDVAPYIEDKPIYQVKDSSEESEIDSYVESNQKISENIKPGVQELFESNPELANEVYEALGFESEDYTGIGIENLDNLIDDNLNVNWALLDKLQEELFSKEAKWTLKNRPEKHSGEKFTWEHIQNVVESAKKISIPSNVDRKTLILAALLHDIGKPYRNEDHALDSVKVINRLFKDNKYSKLVKLAVRYHMISTSTSQEEYKKIVRDVQRNKVKSEDFIELLLALNIADITRNREENVIDDYSGKSIKNTLLKEIPFKRKQLETISQQQKQQAQQQYSQYLDTIFPNSKVKGIYVNASDIKIQRYDKKYIGKTDAGESGRGFYFTTIKQHGDAFNVMYGGINNYVLLNIKNNLHNVKGLEEKIWGNTIDNIRKEFNNSTIDGIYKTSDVTILDTLKGDIVEQVVFEPEQIHILGSKQDIEGFKEFVKNNNIYKSEVKSLEQYTDEDTQRDMEIDCP